MAKSVPTLNQDIKLQKAYFKRYIMTLQERVNIVVDMCNREIERQEVFMRCAERHNNEHEWLRRYDLQGVYQTVYDILTDNFELDEYNQ